MNSSSMIRLACITVLLLAAAATGRANELANPGFETDAVLDAAPVATTTGWSGDGLGSTASANAAPTRTGIGSLQLASPSAWQVPEAYQTFPATPGQTWNFQGYMLATNTLPAGTTFGLLKIVWADAGGVEIAPGSAIIGGANNSANPGVESTPFLNSGSTPNTWIFTQAKGIAPAGTAMVKLYALLVDESPSTIFLDDLDASYLAATPLNASITSPLNAGTVGTDFTINAESTVLPGSVTNVYFYDGTTLLGNDDTSPYSFTVTGASMANHALKVVAKDNNGGSVTSAVVNVTVATAVSVYVDPSKAWAGYMNPFETPQNGGAWAGWGSGWGTAALCANWSGSTLTLSPNTMDDPSAYWYDTTSSPSIANKIMEATMYVTPAGSLPGMAVTFTGMCFSNSLVSLSNTNPMGNGWTCVAFVKDSTANYSSVVVATVPLTNGMPFSVTLNTINDPTRHVQYGFQTVGPCVWPADPVLPSYGNVKVGPLPTSVSITPSLSGGDINLSFPTETGFVYTVQYKVNLTDVSWSTLAVTNGTGSTAVVLDSIGGTQRFYQLSIQ